MLGDESFELTSQGLFFLNVSFAFWRPLKVIGSWKGGDHFVHDLALDLELVFNNLTLRIKLQQLPFELSYLKT